MAVVAEEKKDENQQTQAPAPVTGGAGPAAQQGGGRLATYSTGSQLSKGSGRFTNLKSYIDANKGAGEQLGSKIGAGLEKQVNKASDTTQAQNIGKQVEAEKDRLAQGQQFKTQLGEETGAQTIAGNQDTSKQFSNLLNNQNVASNLMQQAQTAQSQQNIGLQKAQQNVEQLGTEAGRFNLLKGAVKNPNYTSGQQRLDQLFLQAGNPQQLVEKQRALAGNIGQSGKALETMYGQLGTDIGDAGTQAEEVSKMLRGELGTQTKNLTEAQRAEAEQINTQNALRNTALESYFKGGANAVQDPEQQKYIQDMLASGGLQSGMRTYNVLKEPESYKNYAKFGGTGYKAADVLNQQEFQRYSALQKLAEAQGPGEFTGAGAGGVATEFRGQDLASAITGARSALEQQFGGTDVSKTIETGLAGSFSPNQGIKTTVTGNLMDLLKQKESGNLNAMNQMNNISYDTSGADAQARAMASFHYANDFGRNFSLEKDLLTSQLMAQNQGVARQQTAAAQQQVWQQFLDNLNQQGYDNTLGGVSGPTPTNTFNVK